MGSIGTPTHPHGDAPGARGGCVLSSESGTMNSVVSHRCEFFDGGAPETVQTGEDPLCSYLTDH